MKPDRYARLRRMRRRRHMRRARKAGVWSVLSLSVLGILAGLAVVLIIDQTFRAPEWLRDRVEARLEAGLGGLQIEFGDVSLVISEGWRPRAALQDVTLSDAEGRQILTLADARASLAMRPLLGGQVQPKSITLTGAFAVLRRDADGAVSLAFDGATAPVEEAQGLAELIGRVDEVLTNPQLAALEEVDLLQVNLRYEDAVSGQAWTVDSGGVRLTREADELRLAGNFSILTGRDFASEVEVNYSSTIGEATAAFGLSLTDVPARDIASQSLALSWLTPLRAPLSGALRGSIEETGEVGPLNATLQIGPGALQPTEQTRPIPFETAQAYFTYFPSEQLLQFDEVSIESGWVTGSAEGTMFLRGLSRGELTGLIGQMRLTKTQLNPGGLYPEPVVLNAAEADFQMELDPFTLTLGQLFISEQGNELHIFGAARAAEEGWSLSLDGEMDGLTPERLVELWPEAAIPKTRSWIEKNLTGGRLSDLNVALRIEPGRRPDVYLDFDYANSQIQFMRTMPPILGASGHASLVGNRFVTTATAGRVLAEEGGAVDVAGTSFIIPDTSIRKAAPAVVRLQGRGSITSVLSLLDRDPLNVLEGPGLPATLADGRVAFEGNLALPLKEQVLVEEVEFFVDGFAQGVETDQLIPERVLSAEELNITASAAAVEIAGDVTVNSIPATARWRQPLGQPGVGSQVRGAIDLGPEALEVFSIALPPGSVAGSGKGQFVLDLPIDGAPALALTSDLVGLGLNIPELGWSKSPGQSGTLTLSATLGPAARIDAMTLEAPGLSARGQLTTTPEGALREAVFSEIRRSDWMNVQARLDGRGAGQAPAVRILGGTLDLRRAEFGGAGGRGTAPSGSQALVASLDRLQVTDTIALTGFQGSFGVTRGLEGSFEGRINGQTPVRGAVVPEDGRSAVRVLSDDAGGVFRDAGLLKQGREGSFDMTLRPVDTPGTFDGVITVRDTYVRDGPAIAALLNAVSIVGLVNELAGQGILFSEVAARFRLTPSRVTVYESRATGPSLGLSMDGVYDVPNQRLNMQGVISPVYLLNQIGGLLAPRRGEGLFGFTYTLRGAAQSPQVQVNPLSGLAPGIFREIFRAPSPPVAGTSSGAAPLAPEPADRPQAPQAGDR